MCACGCVSVSVFGRVAKLLLFHNPISLGLITHYVSTVLFARKQMGSENSVEVVFLEVMMLVRLSSVKIFSWMDT